MTVQYGIDGFRDGPFAICVPSVANFWPRWVAPKAAGAKPYPGWPITIRQEARQP